VVKIPRLVIAQLLIISLAGCNRAAMDSNDRFGAGKWRLEGWMESAQGSTQGQPGSQEETVDLTPDQANNPPAAVFFSGFYQGERDWSDVSFSGGKVGGSLHHGAVDVPVLGTYARDHFRVKLDFKGAKQVIEGKLVEPAS
jgi:hypothetical protein